jgi:aminomethyltransferase
MLLKTPFHDRVAALNQTQLWNHWAGHLVVDKYQMSEKFEYFAIRNSAGFFDTSPLYKYRFSGRDVESYLAGVLARDIRRCRPGQAQYTIWCDDRGFVLEDGVILRLGPDDFLLTTAEPNLAYFRRLVGRHQVEIEDVSTGYAGLALQGPRSRQILSALAPEVEDLAYFHLTPAKIAGTPVTISRTGFTGDLGYEVWIPSDGGLAVWDAIVSAGAGQGMIPFGQIALLMARIEAGLLLINVDFESSRFAFNDEHRSTPLELGLGWMFKDLAEGDRNFIGARAIRAEMANGSSRWKLMGLVVDYQEYDRLYQAAGLVPPKDHTPVHGDMMVYGDDGTRVGYASSFSYSPMLQRHIALARVRPDLAKVRTRVNLEFTVNHRYVQVGAHVARLPLYNPERKTA